MLRFVPSLVLLLGLAACASPGPQPQTVAGVDLSRYAGTWHEIARYPNRFQDGSDLRCVDVTATYTPQPDGTVGVLNACRNALRGGRREEAEGWARATDATNTKLRVTFFWPFFGDYWVLGLDPEYRWALVGAPSRRYLWILAREKTLPAADIARAEAIAAARGFDVGRLARTPQE